MTSPEQIKEMGLGGYSQPTYKKTCSFGHDALDGRRCKPQADRQSMSLLITPIH